MSGIVLFGSSTSPFVRKVRMALLAKEVTHEFVLHPSWNPTSGIEALNPLSKVPVLQTMQGTLVFDSRVIIQYLELLTPTPALLPADAMARIAALQTEALADGICDATALFVQEGWRQAQSPIWAARQRDKVQRGLALLEERWTAHHDRGALSLDGIASGAAMGFVRLWLPDALEKVALPALTVMEGELASHPWWHSTLPSVPQGGSFPIL